MTDVVDIGKGEPDFHTPPHIKQAAVAAIDENFTKYTPQAGIPELRAAVARKFRQENGIDVTPEQVVVTCGGKHAMDYVIRCLVKPGDEAMAVSPHWFAYPGQFRLSGGVPAFVVAREANGYLPNPDEVRSAITPRTKLLVLNTPNNPTGAVYPRELLEAMARLALEHGLWVVADEVYEKLVFDEARHVSLASLGPDIACRTVTVNSVSKTHAMTGWRIGYAALPGDLADRVTRMQGLSTSAPSAVSQRAALAALSGDQTHVAAMVAQYAQRRRFVLERIAAMPYLSVRAPAGTFYAFIGLGPLVGPVVRDADEFVRRLLEEAKVSIVSGVGSGAPGYLRLSFAVSMPALEEGLDRVERFVTRLDTKVGVR